MIPLKDINPTRTVPFFTISLIVINCLVFIFQMVKGLDQSVLEYGSIPYFVTHPASRETVYRDIPVRYRTLFGERTGIQQVEVERPRSGAFGSLLTSMFLHGGIFHLVINMLFLWVFGDNIEDTFGHAKFLFFYLICGVGAAFTHVLFHPEALVPMVGASGAISGIMGAYFLMFPRARVLTLVPFFFFLHFVELPAFIFLGIWFLFQLISLGAPTSVAFLAHIGGFIIGLALTGLFRRRRRPPGNPEFRYG